MTGAARERHASNTSNKGRVTGGQRERESDREATRERETCNTSNQGRMSGGGRVDTAAMPAVRVQQSQSHERMIDSNSLWTLSRLYLRLWRGHGAAEPAHVVHMAALCRFSRGGDRLVSCHLSPCIQPQPHAVGSMHQQALTVIDYGRSIGCTCGYGVGMGR